MRALKILALTLVFSIIFAIGASAGQIPNSVAVFLFDGPESVFYQDLSGNISFGGITGTWAVNNFNAEATLAGTYNSPDNFDVFYVEWLNTGDTMPLSVNITSSTPGKYSIYPVFQRPGDIDPIFSLAQDQVTGDTYFGHYFPACEMMTFAIYLDESDTAYDVTVTMEWGTGVPSEPDTWDGVKSLYR